MSTFKKLMALLLCLTMVFTLAACANEEPVDNSAELDAVKDSLVKVDDNCVHAWGKWEEKVENTCTTDGIEVHTCENCGGQEAREMPAFGHKFKDGRCKDCDKKEKKCEHDDTDEVIVKPATCTEKGKMHEICEDCFAVVDDERLDPLGHNYEWREYKEATCTERGWYSHEICTNCGDGYVKFIDPTGHNFVGGNCTTCGAKNANFTTMTIHGLVQNSMTVTPAAGDTYTAEVAVIEVVAGTFTQTGEEHVYTLTAANAGVYRLWFSEIYSGNDVDLYIYDSVGTRIGYNTYCGNDEGCTVTLEAAGVYTVKVSQRRGLCSYNLNLGMQKAVQDISSYDKIVDSIDFDDQEIYYSFTPTESGLYRFTFSEMMADLDVNIYVYNYLGEQVYYNTWCGNGDGVTATNLNAAETYIICVTEKNGTGAFNLSVGKQTATLNINGYTSVVDAITFTDQCNYYTFMADSSDMRIEITGMTDDAYVDLHLYNYLGETVDYDYWCRNNEGLSLSNLTVGETYTIRIEEYGYATPYTLGLYTAKPAADITVNTGVIDSIEYSGQMNTYNLTVDQDGTYNLYILNSDGTVSESGWDTGSVCVEVYDVDGNYVGSDGYMNGNDSIYMELKANTKYVVYVRYDYGRPTYMLSIE